MLLSSTHIEDPIEIELENFSLVIDIALLLIFWAFEFCSVFGLIKNFKHKKTIANHYLAFQWAFLQVLSLDKSELLCSKTSKIANCFSYFKF